MTFKKYIDITNEMRATAKQEANRRDQYIKHHFEVEHLSYQERDEIGFLGEFAFSCLLNLNWKKNIRDNYLTIDDFDIRYKSNRIDVKTETVPPNFSKKIIKKTILDDELYGRRLINQGQVPLLSKYDVVMFGLFVRGKYDWWFPIGWLETQFILNNYKITNKRPDGGYYPFAALPVRTSDLKEIEEL